MSLKYTLPEPLLHLDRDPRFDGRTDGRESRSLEARISTPGARPGRQVTGETLYLRLETLRDRLVDFVYSEPDKTSWSLHGIPGKNGWAGHLLVGSTLKGF